MPRTGRQTTLDVLLEFEPKAEESPSVRQSLVSARVDGSTFISRYLPDNPNYR